MTRFPDSKVTKFYVYLDEAVMEVEAEQACGLADVLLEHFLEALSDDGLELGAGGLVESPRHSFRRRRNLSRRRGCEQHRRQHDR